ncbi:MAG: LPS export ABC transporter permease LptG [Candidatus Firestonebacteria bacterium]
MSIIERYITREVLQYFCIILATIIGIYIVVDFFDETDIFFESGLSFPSAFFYFISKMPVVQFIPISVLLSVLITFGLMNKHNEITALKSGGAGIYDLFRPMLLIGALFFFIIILLSEVIVPIIKNKAERIWAQESRKKSSVTLKEKNIWIRGDRLIAHIGYFNSTDKTIYGITLNFFDDNFRVIRRLDAAKGVYKEGLWIFFDIIEQRLGGKNNGIILHKEIMEKLDFSPEGLGKVAVKSEAMNVTELYDYIRKIEFEGYDATKYWVDFYAKLAFPFVCITMCIVGTGIALRLNAKESIPVSIVYGIGTVFFYWIFYSFCLSLGYGGVLNPLVSALVPNLIFLCFGVFTLLNAE